MSEVRAGAAKVRMRASWAVSSALGLRVGDGHEANSIAGLDLSHLPQFGAGDGYRANKPAQAGSVASEDHGSVASKVDAADGIDAIMHVRRVQTRFAAGIAGP